MIPILLLGMLLIAYLSTMPSGEAGHLVTEDRLRELRRGTTAQDRIDGLRRLLEKP